jgi:hypothetical protein
MVFGNVFDEPTRLPPGFGLIKVLVHAEEEGVTRLPSCDGVSPATIATAEVRGRPERAR